MTFRFKGLKGLFTYHDFSPTTILTKEIVFEQLVSLFDSLDFEIYKYFLVRETKKNPHIVIPYFEEKASIQHFPIYFELKSKTNKNHEIDTKDASRFDLFINNQKIHGNYSSLKTFFDESKKKKALRFDFDNPSIESKEIFKKFLKKNYIRGSFAVIMYLLKEDSTPYSNLPVDLIELLRKARKSFLSSDELQKEENNYSNSLKVVNFPSIKMLSLEETINYEKKEIFQTIVSSTCIKEVEPISVKPISVNFDSIEKSELFFENELKEVLCLENFNVLEKILASETNLVTILLLNSFSKNSNDLITNLLNGSFVIENTKSCNELENKKGNSSILLFHNCNTSIDLLSIITKFLESITGENALNNKYKLFVLFDLNTFSLTSEMKQNEIINFIKKMKQITDSALSKKNFELENELLLFLNALNCESPTNRINLTITTNNTINNTINNNTNTTNNMVVPTSYLLEQISSLQSELKTALTEKKNLMESAEEYKKKIEKKVVEFELRRNSI